MWSVSNFSRNLEKLMPQRVAADQTVKHGPIQYWACALTKVSVYVFKYLIALTWNPQQNLQH